MVGWWPVVGWQLVRFSNRSSLSTSVSSGFPRRENLYRKIWCRRGLCNVACLHGRGKFEQEQISIIWRQAIEKSQRGRRGQKRGGAWETFPLGS